jgi:clan AA aspartic protease (TIGR02281 family)
MLIIMQLPVSAEYYEYSDGNGTISFTDNPASIPAKSKNTKIYEIDEEIDSRTATRINYINNQILVPVTVNYRGVVQTATFLLDTGATTCTISPGLAKRLNIRKDNTDVGLAQGVGGSVHLVGRTELNQMTVGPISKYNIEVSVIPTGKNDGLLGMNFLHGLRYHIDYNTREIKWGE